MTGGSIMASDNDRVFTQEELDEFSKDFTRLAIEALDAGEIEQAKAWLKRHDETKDILHDLYLHWITGLLSHIYDHHGEDAAVRAVRDTATRDQSQWGYSFLQAKKGIMKEAGFRGWIRFLVDVLRQHSMYPGLTVEEDDEKFTLTMDPCGSGGRLINMGAYEGPYGYRKLKNPGPHTWGEKDLPIYCSHCPWAHEISPLFYGGEEGSQLWVHGAPFPKKPGEPCVWLIYKDPANIPDKYYDRIGMTRKPRTLPPTSGLTDEIGSGA
jgi:hypothetical protein